MSLLKKLRNANEELAFERQSEIDFEYVDSLIQDSTGKPERVLEQGYSIREAEPEEAQPLPGLEMPKRVA